MAAILRRLTPSAGATALQRAMRGAARWNSLVPMVLESTPRGERAFDIFSRLLQERVARRAPDARDARAARARRARCPARARTRAMPVRRAPFHRDIIERPAAATPRTPRPIVAPRPTERPSSHGAITTTWRHGHPQERIVCLNGAIDDGVSAVVVAQLLYLEAQSTEKPINMYINSPGGWREIERDRAEMVLSIV